MAVMGDQSSQAGVAWALHAMQLLHERPEIPFGIHLTLVCDTNRDRWGPLTARREVPSLLDPQGELFANALQMAGVVTPGALSRARRYAAVGIVALVAVITPSGDPITLIVLSVPMYLFYEISIVYGRLWHRRRRRREAAATGAVT